MPSLNKHVQGYAYGDCRLLGHFWHVVPSDWTPAFGEPFTVRCERCDIERRDSLNRNTGEVQSRRYTYPVGYQFVGIDAELRPRRDDFRLAWLIDNIEKAREAKRNNKRG